jgi:hypothetical protein
VAPSRSAGHELRLAREKLERAREAMEEGDHRTARRLAEQAYVDAEVAGAKARAAKAQIAAREAREGVEMLRGTVGPPGGGQ